MYTGWCTVFDAGISLLAIQTNLLTIIRAEGILGVERQCRMSVNLSLPKEVADFICGPDRPGYVDDVCRQKVTRQYGEHTSGLYGEQWATFADYMRVVLGQFQSEAKTLEIERNMKATENKIFASCGGKEDWVVQITGENWGPDAQCVAEKYRKIDVDKILGTFDIAGISRPFTETLKHIRDLALNVGE